MTRNDTGNPDSSHTLRERAADLVRTAPTDVTGMTPDDIQKLVLELQTHQIELELQTEDLRQAQVELAQSRDRYVDLYDFAPLGYVSITGDGQIIEANLSAAALLGVHRQELLRTNINRFVDRSDHDDVWRHRQAVLARDGKRTCEVSMRTADRTPLIVCMESIAFGTGKERHCRTALIDVTASRHAQHMRESEQRYRRLTDAVTDYVYSVRVENDRVMRTTHGENCVAVTGYTSEELSANPLLWISIVPSEDRNRVEQQTAQILDNRKPAPVEHRIQRKDGTIRWVLNTVSPQYDDGGTVIAFDGLVRDITDQKIAEDGLRDLNQQLERRVAERTREAWLLASAVSHLGEGVIITRDHLDWPGPKIAFANAAMCRITGYTADELIGRSPRILQGDASDRKTLKRIKAKLSGGESCSAELINYRKDGSSYAAEVFITPLYDADGHRTNFVSVHRDITERRAMEEKLRAEQELLENIIHTAQCIVLMLDTDGRIIRLNPYLENLSGWRSEDLLGRNWFETFVRPQDRRPVREIFSYLLKGSRTRGQVDVIICRDGREREIEWYDAPLTNSEGALIGLLAVGQDVTENRALTRFVLHATTEEQRRIGQDLHDGVGQELAGLSMLADTLARTLRQTTGESTELDVIRRNEIAAGLAAGLKDALKQLKTLARGMHPVEVDPAGLSSALHELARNVAERYSVSCEVHGGAVSVTDKDTATHLYRIAQEATTNAVTHGGASRIIVSLERSGGSVQLEIQDNGSGIPADVQSREGMGLQSMQYRAGLIGGTLVIAPGDASGTIVMCVCQDA